MVLAWDAHAFYAGGAKPSREKEESARKHEFGLARVNLNSGKVEMVRLEKPFPLSQKLPKALEGLKSSSYSTGPNYLNDDRPVVTGKKLVLLRLEREAKQLDDALYLDFYDLASGKKLPPVRLMKGKVLWSMLSSDGKKLFVHQALPKEDLPAGDDAWWVFDLETGKQLAKLQLAKLPSDWALVSSRNLVDGRYYVLLERHFSRGRKDVVERVLKAIDSTSSRVIWERAVWSPPALRIPS